MNADRGAGEMGLFCEGAVEGEKKVARGGWGAVFCKIGLGPRLWRGGARKCQKRRVLSESFSSPFCVPNKSFGREIESERRKSESRWVKVDGGEKIEDGGRAEGARVRSDG
jgi:hypothetical protein